MVRMLRVPYVLCTHYLRACGVKVGEVGVGEDPQQLGRVLGVSLGSQRALPDALPDGSLHVDAQRRPSHLRRKRRLL